MKYHQKRRDCWAGGCVVLALSFLISLDACHPARSVGHLIILRHSISCWVYKESNETW